jgi:Tfp pilus assembly protein PilF
MRDLAKMYRDQSYFEKAALCCKSALSGMDRWSENPPGGTADEAEILGELGTIEYLQGDNIQAEVQYKRALEVARSAGSEESKVTADILRRYGALLDRTGRFEEAHQLFARASAILDKTANK